MKYEGKRPSGQDKDIPVYTFSMGRQELFLLANAMFHLYKNIPAGIFELQPTRKRAQSAYKCLEKVARDENMNGFFKQAKERYENPKAS